jgi:two-component system cell cycle sensor histidine kinase/response regulator CckA
MDLDTGTQTILLVDDDCAIRTLVRAYLERAGYAVLTAGNGVEGVSVFQQHQESIALLLSDVLMPKMGGLQLADTVLTLRPQLPVLFISGNMQSADRGCGCIAKPFTSAELVGRVRQVLANKEPLPASERETIV